MRRVKYYEYEKRERIYKGTATFHQFGAAYEEFDSGPGNYSTAIIELDDGTVKNIWVENIEFVNEKI